MQTYKSYTKRLGIKLTILTIFAIMLYGCGFQLRGWNQKLPTFMQKVYISYNGNDYSFINNLKSSIASTGSKVVKRQKDSNIVIQINSTNSNERVIAITGGASSSTSILSYTANYQILTNTDNVIVASQINSASQNYNTNSTQQLSNNAQKQEIINSLQGQVADNIINQMQNISKQSYYNSFSQSNDNTPEQVN